MRKQHFIVYLMVSLWSSATLLAQKTVWQNTFQTYIENFTKETYSQAAQTCELLDDYTYSSASYAATLLAKAKVNLKHGDYQKVDSLLTIAGNLSNLPDSLLFDITICQSEYYNKIVDLKKVDERFALLRAILTKKELSPVKKAAFYVQVALHAVELEEYHLAEKRLLEADSILALSADNILLKTQIYYQLGEVYYQSDRYKLSEKSLQTALFTLEQKYNTNHTEAAMIYNHQGRLYNRLNRSEEALSVLKKAKQIQLEKLGEYSREYAITLSNLAGTYMEVGNYELAEQHLEEALSIFENKTKSRLWIAFSRSILGYTLFSLGQQEFALQEYNRAKKIYKQLGKNDDLITLNNRISAIYIDQNQLDTALFILKNNINLCREKLGEENITYALISNDLAELYLQKSEYQNAETYYLQAKNILADLVGKKHYYYASVLNNLAYTYQKSGQLDLAEKYYLEMEAIDRATIGEQHPDFVYSQYGMANFYALQKSPKAKDYFIGANRGQLNLIYDYYAGFDESTRLSYLEETQRNFDEFYSYIFRLEDKENLVAEAQNLSLATKGLALDFSVANRVEEDRIPSAIKQQWLAKRDELAAAYGLSKVERDEQNINLATLKTESEQLEKELIRSDQNERLQLQNRQRFTVKDIQQKLAKDAATIDFIRANYYAFDGKTDSIFYYAILHFGDDRAAEFIQIGEEKHMQSLLQNSAAYVQYPQIGKELYQLIWQPLAPYLTQVKTIHIAPDGLLHRIAFGALPTADGYLADKYNLLYYNHLRDFVQQEKIEKGHSIALVGGAYFDLDSMQLAQLSAPLPDLQFNVDSLISTLPLVAVSRAIADDSTRSAVRFNYLAGTQREVEKINKIFQQKKWQTNLLTGEEALEDQVKYLAKANSPDVLHFATHGYFFNGKNGNTDHTLRERIINADHPLIRSGLVFTGVNHTWQGGKKIQGLDDGVLTALEISNLNLSTTDLVVLSACETGMGDVQGGEGVFGLQRAFKMAGAKQLVLSLWKVSDAATAELMEYFYKEYLKGNSAAAALRKAQQKMKKRYVVRDWAGFVLIN